MQNARFQWRFRPVSDFFLVYTGNHFAEGPRLAEGCEVGTLGTKNRALVAKVTYWFSP